MASIVARARSCSAALQRFPQRITPAIIARGSWSQIPNHSSNFSSAIRSEQPFESGSTHVAFLQGRPFRSFSAMSSSSDPDYDLRAEMFGMPTKDELRSVVDSNPDAVFLDVRSPPELEEATLKTRKYLHCWCTMDDQSGLVERAGEILPDKDATVIVFCGVGGRSSKAKAVLDSMGYSSVYNGGGLKDLGYLDE